MDHRWWVARGWMVVVSLLVGALVGGLYGALHDQLSYALSPDYFTRFKFIQFRIYWGYESPRWGAAWVGFRATWWLGGVVGLVLSLFALLFHPPRRMARRVAEAMVLALLVTLLALGLGLLHVHLLVDASNMHLYRGRIWPNVADQLQFVRVGILHLYSYSGALLGLCSGLGYLSWHYRRQHGLQQPSRSAKSV